ncbi:hypothetical protein MSG28_013305 [Choristoneura fumiferana]|uniref:Uncharacterized protein n=1 Tax=Choristoneura fumiferana TaxID=7141 RepID=A0ACC0KST4_CHOFU|nr:hypothetical protein MSG28_013305 [Choristoneura fumiferana]
MVKLVMTTKCADEAKMARNAGRQKRKKRKSRKAGHDNEMRRRGEDGPKRRAVTSQEDTMERLLPKSALRLAPCCEAIADILALACWNS